jgi:hypothetical protein
MNTISYNGKTYTEQALFDMSSQDRLALHNELAVKAGKQPTKRFSTLGTGVKRTWALLTEQGEAGRGAAKAAPKTADKPAPKMKPAPKAKAKDAPATERRVHRGTNLLPPSNDAPIPCRAGTKQAIMLDLLSTPNGATMDDLIKALSGGRKPWTEGSVRAGFGWDMKQKGYGVRSEFDEDGVERFFIVLPKGHDIPKHKISAAAKAA